MLLERTITTLQCHAETPQRAEELGRLGFLQWLAFLAADAGYAAEARRALAMAAPFEATDPAVAAFCRLVRGSLDGPVSIPDLTLPRPTRRGGARRRRRLL